MKTSDQTNELFTALPRAQNEMGTAKEDGFNKHLGAGYASIDSLHAAYKRACSNHGLAIIQDVYSEGEDYFLETRLTHSSGQWMSSSMKLLLAKRDMQSLGAAVTYAKRYSITSILGISTEVDEAEIEATANKVVTSKRLHTAATDTGKELREKLAADPRPIMNHATGQPRLVVGDESSAYPKLTDKVLDAAANPKTGTVAVTKLVEAMKDKVSPPLEWAGWDHRITFGKYSGKTIREVGYTNALEYFKWMEGEAGGKKLSVSAEMLGQALKQV